MTGLLGRLLGRLWRARRGTLVGIDEFGNKYYEQRPTLQSGQSVMQELTSQNPRRWMVPRGGQKVYMYDPDQVPGKSMNDHIPVFLGNVIC